MASGPDISFASRELHDLVHPHQVGVDAHTGAATIQVGVPITPGRAGFQPSIGLAYNSSAPNSVYGLGWSLSGLPSIALSLQDGLPRYDGTDAYAFAGAQLVPWLEDDSTMPRILDGGDHWIHLYRSTVERTFTRCEKWVHKVSRRVHWRVRGGDNSVSIFGFDAGGRTRIADPEDERRTFEWLLEWQHDAHGNAIHYIYAPENGANVAATESFEYDRMRHAAGYPQRYLTRIHYGNLRPLNPGDPYPGDDTWLFSVVLDYGERRDAPVPTYEAASSWPARPDPFSTYRAGFEIRTYRLCRRILMFHRFGELGTGPTLVGSTALDHRENEAGSTLHGLQHTGYRRSMETGSYTHKSLPALTFRYSEPAVQGMFVGAPEQTRENVPYGIGGLNYRWIDLYGEGLPGILFETHQAWYYKPNLGGGRLGPQQKVLGKPSAQPGNFAISDFDGDGNLNMVILQGRDAGYFEYDRDNDRWGGFRPFLAAPNISSIDATTQLLDLNGDGRADIVTVEDDRIRWYRSKGKDGFAAPVDFAKPSSNGVSRTPTIGPNSNLDYLFADMTGDGLPDQVRVQNGRVEYWPQLGNGHFGPGVEMEGAPVLDYATEFDAGRIRLVDLDGSGTADLLYIGRGEIRYWINASGNRFVEGGTIAGLPFIDNLSSALVLDFLGDGTPCLVWSTALPSHGHAPLQYLRLREGAKPRLLLSMENSAGKEVRISYGHSAAHYLRDKHEGEGWISKLPQHVTVVDRVATIDHIGNTRFESLYEYHDGFFDSEERAFRGFGLVDQYDSDTYGGTSTVPEAEHAHPVCVRTWFHNGMAGWERRRSAAYYRGDPHAASLPGPLIEDLGTLGAGEFAAAFRALAGQVVRTEIYGLGADGRRAPHPFQVTQANSTLRRLQSKYQDWDPCFAVFPGESLTYEYEQNPADPRISHSLTLEIDDFGSVRRSCTVAYPRRTTEHIEIDAQERYHVSVSQADFVNIDEERRYEVGIPRENQTYQLAGLSAPRANGGEDVFRVGDLKRELDVALDPDRVLRFDQSFTGGVEARLVQWERLFFWNGIRTEVLPWNVRDVPSPALVHHTESACGTDALFADVFGGRLTPATAREEGVYELRDGYWWQASPTLHYLPRAQFNLIVRETQRTSQGDGPVDTVTYAYDDPYLLNLTSVTDAVGSRVNATHIDYHLPAPDRITDANENVAAVLYDELGVVVVATQHGRILSSAEVEERYGNDSLSDYALQPDASFDRILAEPRRFLQGASTFHHYDLDTWTASDPQPLRSLSLAREVLVHDGEGSEAPDSRIQTQVVYVDGFGRALQVKERVEPGPAVAVDAGGRLVAVGRADPRWRASGHTLVDNKQRVIRQYEPFFSTTRAFESDDVLETFGETTVTEYDPLGRVVRVRYPNGTLLRTEYAAWETIQHDQNDVVFESQWYAERGSPDPSSEPIPSDPERRAAFLAAEHAGTPTHVHLDALGREVMVMEEGRDLGDRRTFTVLDFAGNPISIVDPRMLTAFNVRRDMLGRVLYEQSIDSGERWTFTDALGRPIHLWDGRGVHQRLEHDALGRVVSVYVDGALELDQYTERMVYGDAPDVPEATLRNLRGKLVRHHDQAGVVDFHRYDPSGRPLDYDRQLAADYTREPHWSDAALADTDRILESRTFVTRLRYDALGRVTWQHLADGTTRHITYQHGGGVGQVRVSTADGVLRDVPFLEETAYNARGQRTGALLGNGVAVRYEYDPETYRLARLYTRQPEPDDPNVLDPDPAPPERRPRRVYQDIRYTYDPVGNVIQIVDRAQEPPRGDVLSRLHGLVHSTSTFRYDPFYQLREASGRAHEALQQHDYDARRGGEPHWMKGTRHLHINNADVVRRYTRTYDYDLGGNLRRIGNALHAPGGDTTRDWHTDIRVSSFSNRSLPAEDLLGLPGPDPDAPTSFDANGNCLYLPHLSGCEWNYRNNLARAVIVSRAEGPDRHDDAEYYVYGANGGRVRKVHERTANGSGQEITEKIYLDGCEIKRVWSGGRVILERTTSHVSDGNDRIALVHQWEVDDRGRETDDLARKRIHYQLSNHLGSSSLELDEHGAVISYEEYFPYGGTAFVAGRSEREVRIKTYRYSGKERDDVTGLYYYGYRYYAPWLGRWLSPDPIGPEDGLNLYRFVQNNPLNLVDPNGLQSTVRVPINLRRVTDEEAERLGWEPGRRALLAEGETSDPLPPEVAYRSLALAPESDRVLYIYDPDNTRYSHEGLFYLEDSPQYGIRVVENAETGDLDYYVVVPASLFGDIDPEEEGDQATGSTVSASEERATDTGSPRSSSEDPGAAHVSRPAEHISSGGSDQPSAAGVDQPTEERSGIELPAKPREPQERVDLAEPLQLAVEFAAYMFYFALGAAHAFLSGILEMGLMAIDAVALTGLGIYYGVTDDLIEWDPVSSYGQLWAQRPGEAEDLMWRGLVETPDRIADAMIQGRPADLGAESINALMMVEGGAGVIQSTTRLARGSQIVARSGAAATSPAQGLLRAEAAGAEASAARAATSASRGGARGGPPRGGRRLGGADPPGGGRPPGGGDPPGGGRPPGGGNSSGGGPRGDRWSLDEVMKRFEGLEEIPDIDLAEMRRMDATEEFLETIAQEAASESAPVRRPVFEGPATEALLDEFAVGAGPDEIAPPRHYQMYEPLSRLNIRSGGRVEAYLKHLLESVKSPVSDSTIMVFGVRMLAEEVDRLLIWLKARRRGSG